MFHSNTKSLNQTRGIHGAGMFVNLCEFAQCSFKQPFLTTCLGRAHKLSLCEFFRLAPLCAMHIEPTRIVP